MLFRSIRQLFDEAFVAVPEGWRLGNFDIHRDGNRVRLEASIGGQDVAGEGNGAVEALMDALRQVHGVSGSVEAFVGVALAEDTTTATLQAVLSAFGRQKAAVRVAA